MTSSAAEPGSLPENNPAPCSPLHSAYGFIRQNFIPVALFIVIIAFLYEVSRYNFALFHTAIEFASIAIAVAIFLLVWKSRHIVENNYLVFIGISFLFIAILDFLHTTVYQGVGILPDGGGTLSTRFWIAARYMEAVTLLAAPLLMRKKIRMDLIAIVYLAADIIIVASIFIFRNFPATYIEGVGLTPFKIISEYIIALLLIGAVVLLCKNRAAFDRQVLDNLVIAIILTILSEIAFTEYTSFVDTFSVIGHVLRLMAYYFFFRAIIEVGQEKPYNLLYRDINESEKKYRALSDLSPDAILVIQEGVIRYANHAGLQLSGVPVMEQLVGRKLNDFIPPDDWTSSVSRIAAIEQEGVIAPLSEIRVIIDGRTIPVEATGGPIDWEGKKAAQIVIRDISERKKAGLAITELNRDLKIILDNIPAMIWYKDTRNNFIRVNQAVVRKTGLPVVAFEGKNAAEIFPEEAGMYYADDLDVIRSGEPRFGIIEHLAATGGQKIWVHTDKIPLRDEAGTITGVLVFSIDITKRRLAEEELKRRHDDLNAAYEKIASTQEALRRNIEELMARERQLNDALSEKEALLAEIHHRVKNNLASFISLLSLDGSCEDTEKGRSLRKDLQNRARSMALIHETLYRTGKFSNVDMEIYLTTLVSQIAGSYAEGSEIRTAVNARGVVLDLARATTAGLIINELVTNSYKYAFPPGFDCMAERGKPCTILVDFVHKDGVFILTVADNGRGMPPGFDPLSAKSLGLKLVTFLARHQLRSDIEILTDPGTSFIFRLKNEE